MHSYLKQSTASQSRSIGPFLDDTDFKTAETGLTIANTDIKLMINGAASANKNSGGGTHRANGVYGVTFDATDTATVGEIYVSVVVAGALPVFATFVVVEEAVYDMLFGASSLGYIANAPVTLADAVAHGGTLGSSTATLALSRLTVASQTSNTNAISATGNGTGHGIAATSGSGATGNGMTLLAASTNGHGLKSTGTGTGDGAELTAGASGADLDSDIAGTLTTVTTATTATNLTNAPTNGDFTATMKTSIGTAVAASAVASVTGNVGGNVTGSVGSIATGGIADASYATTAGKLSALGIVDQGTAQAATGTTLQLRSAAAFADDELIGATILIVSGTAGAGQARVITDYDSATDTATVDTWTTTPTGTIVYKVFGTAPSSGGGGGGLDAAGVRAAIGMASANLDTQLSTIDTVVDAILVDTGTTLDGRIPAALVGGRMDASVGAMAANTMTAAAAAADLTTELQTGLATSAAVATLQTSVDDLPTNAELATALGTADDAVLARLGAPAGASIAADIAAVKVDSAAVKVKTDSLTFTTAGMVDSAIKRVGNTTLNAAGTGGQGYGA